DGVVRAFRNVCQHRGNKVVKTGTRSCKSLVCNFHGWAYDLEGRLIHVPDHDQFFDLDRSKYSLSPVAVDVWEGFIFINMDPNPAETLQEWMGELFDQLNGYQFQAMPRVAAYSATVNVNWKIFIDAFQENYHNKFLHKHLIGDIVTSKDNPFAHPVSIRLYKRHRALSTYANPYHKPTPAESIAFGPAIVSRKMSDEALPMGINPERSLTWSHDGIQIFPNLYLGVSADWWVTYNFWPEAVDRTLFDVKIYMRRPKNAGERIGQEFSKAVTRELLREDLSTLEDVQTGMSSGGITRMPLSDQEILVRHALKVVEDFVRSTPE
ncbi:MAG TPA: SRPBCC family protein, partial [Blastocatellia bacterium]